MFRAMLLVPLLLAQAAEEAPPPASLKPQVRTVQLSSGQLQFNVKVEPGAPDAGWVVDVRVELAMVPPVPDPIYGERIPVKQARLVATVADQDGGGYRTSYLVHPLSDAGLYGFHFTPLRSDVYLLEFSTRYNERDYQVSCKVPVGIWPFPTGTDKTAESDSSSMRMPALPTSLQTGGQPAGVSPAFRPQKSAFQQGMASLGTAFSQLTNSLLAAGRADFARAGEAAAAMKNALSSPAAAEMKELAQLLEDLAGRIKASDASGSVNALRRLAEGCNTCHLSKRWKLATAP